MADLCCSEVDLNVRNEFLFREIHNIIATIHGQYEKGQSVQGLRQRQLCRTTVLYKSLKIKLGSLPLTGN